MSNALFPNLPGLTWEMKMRPTFATVPQQAASGEETRIANRPYPKWEFDLVYEFLRDFRTQNSITPQNPAGYTELEQIVGFYLQRHGSFDSFLIDPAYLSSKPGDGRVQGQQIGVGDGATTAFQLVRPYGGFLDRVQVPNGKPVVYVNRVPVAGSAWTLGPKGTIVFIAPPATGAIISADFRWYYRVRFADDALEFDAFSFQFWELQTLKLVQVYG